MEKQKKGLFGSRSVYYISSLPIGAVVSRRRSDFEWLSDRLRIEIPSLLSFEGNDKSHVESYLKILTNNPDVVRHPFFIYFFTCTNNEAFHAKKKKQQGNKTTLGSLLGQPSKMNNRPITEIDGDNGKRIEDVTARGSEGSSVQQFLDQIYSLVKGNREIVKDIQKYYEDLAFLLDQTNQKLRKIGTSFAKLSENWAQIENFSLYLTVVPKTHHQEPVSFVYQDIKMWHFKWYNSIENTKQNLKKSFSDSISSLLQSSKDLKRSLKTRKESEGSQIGVADDISITEFVKHTKVEKETAKKWLIDINEIGMFEKNMEMIMMNSSDHSQSRNETIPPPIYKTNGKKST